MAFSPNAATVYQDGPSADPYEPSKPQIRELLTSYETVMDAFTTNAGLIFTSLVAMNAAAPSYTEPRSAWLLDGANSGVYVLDPTTDTWMKVGRLPYDFVIGTDLGAGTANAIQITTDIPVSDGMIVAFELFEGTSSSPVTVSINGGTALTVKTNRGNNASALTAGMDIWGRYRSSDSTLRLLNDQDVSALVEQAEAAAVAAQAAQAAAEAAAAGVTLPSAVASTYLRQKTDVSGYETVTAQQVREDIDPTGQVLNGDGLKLTYHKARGAWHVAAFGSSLTSVGSGSTAADQAALAAAMASQEMVDIDGTILQIEDPIVIDYPGANISARKSGRVGDIATSKIKLMDDTMPCLFEAKSTNFETSGFAVTGNATNTTTTGILYKRPDGEASDIDSVMKDMVFERMAKPFHIYGRGLEVGDYTFAEMKASCGDIDWPSDWTPNGQSNDTQETGMRAYHFYNGRMHGNVAGFRNIGANAQNMRGLIIDGALADIGSGGVGGGGLFIGVLGEGSVLNNLVANISASIAGGLVNLHAGSRASVISNFTCRGIKSGVTRVLRTPITIATTVANPVYDLVFANGSLGVCNRDGMLISGAGTAYVTLNGVMFDRTNMESAIYSPVRVIEDSAGAMTDVWVKMSNCNFRFGGELAPTAILGGLNSANVHLRRDYTTTKPAAIAWAGGSVDNIGP